ncbi:M16 family metallopeptidase [Treponema sp.]|uniref:M16 family metallopeptidase n=1 Tax=Treponema sp. TaxID=166 RepID=UPI00298E554A|nr:insulinase family protein [Treponema sp.]
MIKKNKIVLILSLLFSEVLFFNCASTNGISGGTRIKTQNYDSLDEEPFYSQNAETFFEKKLSNGIPVIIKKSKNQNSCAVRLVIDSVPLSDSFNKSGLEKITLELMRKGTSKYSELYISSMEYTDSTVFTTKVHQDYLEYGISSQKDRLDTVVEIFAQTFKNPLMDEAEFNEITDQLRNSASPLLTQVYKILNSQDKYFSPCYLTEQASVSYKDVLDYQKGLLNAARITIIASGNFSDEDVENLYKVLENNFSSLKKFNYRKKQPSKKLVQYGEKFTFVEKKAYQNISALGFADIPFPLGDSYISYALLSLYLDDLIYSHVKEKHSAAQDAGTGVLLSKLNIGIISIYDISSVDKATSNLNEMLENSLTEDFIEKKLDSYKRIYTSFVMNSEIKAEKTLDQMASSLVYCGDAKEYLKRPYKISKITAAQVREVFDKYLNGKICWVINNIMTK